jgi:hypothetical protein
MSVSTRGTGPSRIYTPRSFHSANVKEVYIEEWLNVAKAHIPSAEQGPARRLDDGGAGEAGGRGPREVVVIVDCCLEHQRRSPWVGWGEFPLFPVGDPPALTALSSRVSPSLPRYRQGLSAHGECVSALPFVLCVLCLCCFVLVLCFVFYACLWSCCRCCLCCLCCLCCACAPKLCA